jgi:hypothetical protein
VSLYKPMMPKTSEAGKDNKKMSPTRTASGPPQPGGHTLTNRKVTPAIARQKAEILPKFNFLWDL